MSLQHVKKIRPYNGKEPYIFISYAHKDSEAVVPAIRTLQQGGYRIWYDLGIEAGTEWSNNIAQHLQNCSVFIAFISKNSVQSENCLDEIAFAKSHQKPALMIFLEDDVVLPSGTEMQTARFQRMYYNRQSSQEEFLSNINRSPMLDSCLGEKIPAQDTPAPTPTETPAVPKKKLSKKVKITLISVIAVILIAAITLGTIIITRPKKTRMSDNLLDYTFTLDEVVYQLPFDYTLLTENGWICTNSTSNNENEISGLDTDYVYMGKNDQKISIYVYNPSGSAAALENCQVVGISVYNLDASFSIAKGIEPGVTKEEIINAFGEPNSTSDTDEYGYLYYGADYFSSTGVTFNLSIENGTAICTEIEIKNLIENTSDASQTNNSVPEYLSEYTAPEKLGDDPFSGVVKIDSDLYSFPAPLKVFVDNGWTVSSKPDFVVSNGSEDVTITKDSCSLTLNIYNFASYQTTAENCAAIGFYAYDEEAEIITLPGNISTKTTDAEIAELFKDKEDVSIYDSEYYKSYSYSDSDERFFSLSIDIDSDTDTVNDISLRQSEWIWSE